MLVTLSSFPALITRAICVTIRFYKLCETHSQREGCGCKTILFLQNLAGFSQKKLKMVSEVAKLKAVVIQRDFADF